MKKLLVVIVSTLVSNTASADIICEAAAKFARNAMSNRQHGVPLPKALETGVYEIKNKNDPTDIAANALTRGMILEAYSRPRFTRPEYIEREITDFESEVLVACEKDLRRSK